MIYFCLLFSIIVTQCHNMD